MAIDSRGQVTTTGILNKPDTNLQVPNMGNLTSQVKQPTQPIQQAKRPIQPIPQITQPTEGTGQTDIVKRLQNITAEDMTVLAPVLSPSVKTVLAKIIPEISPLLEGVGTDEETVPVKVSTFASLPGDIQDFIIKSSTQQMDTNNVPLDTASDTSSLLAKKEPSIPDTPEEGMNYDQIDEIDQTTIS